MLIETLCPELVYALKPNIKFPGTQPQATAAEGVATQRFNDATSPLATGFTVPAGTIKLAN